MDQAKMTRIRIEAAGTSEEIVTKLLKLTIKDHDIGENDWEEEKFDIQTSKNGFWGQVTMRRKNENQVSAS